MKKYSEDKFEFKSNLTPVEIFNLLNNRTLRNNSLIMELTDKDFIGRISPESFSIIDSSFPYGAACVLKGTISPTSTISFTTSLHKAFRIIYLIWLILMTGVFLTGWLLGPANLGGLIAFIIIMPMGAFLFRLFFHGIYVLGRNNALIKMKRILISPN